MQKINFMPPIIFEILKFKNAAIWLAKSVFAFNSRTRFFPEMWFQHGHFSAWFKSKKSAGQWTIFFENQNKTIFGVFWPITPKWDFFPKNPTLLAFYPYSTLTSWEVSEKSYAS